MTSRNPQLIEAIRLSNAGRNDQAVPIIQQLAAGGDAEALYILAEMNWRGGIVPLDVFAARTLYFAAGQRGHGPSGVIFTNLLASGVAGPRDWPQAVARLELEAQRSPSRAVTLAVLRAMALTEDGEPVSLPEPQRLSETPDVQLFPSLFTAAECEYLGVVATPHYVASIIQKDGREVPDPIRTSEGAALHWQIEDPAVHALNRRLAAASGSDAANGEPMQILRYRPGQQYRSHLDFTGWPDNERVTTALAYLNDDFEGGETRFTKTGLTVRARRGDAIVFRNALPDGRADPMAEHAGLPVTRGEKLLASRWIRETRWIP